VNEKWDGLDQALDTICFERELRREAPEKAASSTSEERARKLNALKEQIRDGLYKPDIKDIARLLTSALDRGM